MGYLPNPNLPAPLYQLLTTSSYSRGESRYSITDLLRTPQQLQLSRRYPPPDKDCRENIYSVLGSAVHAMLESIGAKNPIEGQTVERRLFSTIQDVEISGQIDLHCTIDGGILTDYKNTKIEILKYDTKLEWEQQLNCYVYLLRLHGVEVSQARVVVIFRNWSITGFGGLYKTTMSSDGKSVIGKKNKDYPEWGCEEISIPLWSEEQTKAFIEERVRIHDLAEEMADDELPPCTDDERWRHNKYIIRQRGLIKPHSTHKTQEEAQHEIQNLHGDYVIASVQGVPYKCTFFCDGKNQCSQINREGLQFKFDV